MSKNAKIILGSIAGTLVAGGVGYIVKKVINKKQDEHVEDLCDLCDLLGRKLTKEVKTDAV